MTTVVLVQQGGTGANNAADALGALGAAPIAAYDKANSALEQANAAYTAANTGTSNVSAAYDQANAAYAQANAAYEAANNAQVTVYQNSSSSITTQKINFVNTSTITVAVSADGSNANVTFTAVGGAAYDQANAAYGQANLAYAAANNSNLLSGGLVSGTLNVTQDLIVGGNIYLEGNTTYINVATYSVEDPLIYLASNNDLTDSVDIGFMGGKNTSGTYSHTGLARDATDGKWKLFDGLAEEGHVGNVVDFANTYLATLVANVEANNITVLGNKVAVNTDVAAAYSQANLAYTAANNAVLRTGDTMTGRLGISNTTNNVITSGIILTGNRNYVAGDNGGIQIFATGSGGTIGTHDYGAIKFYARGFTGAGDGGGGIVSLHVGGSSSNATSNGMFIQADGTIGQGTQNVKFYTGVSATERMRIDVNGNVGIGTATANAPLAFSTALGSAGEANKIRFYETGNNIWGLGMSNGLLHVRGGDFSSIAFYTSADTSAPSEKLRITGAGNIGIGTSSPTDFGGRNLSIHSPSSSTYASQLWVSGAYVMEALVNEGSSVMSFGSRSNNKLDLCTNDTTRMTITNTGSVGIGTASPGGLLGLLVPDASIYGLSIQQTGTSARTINEFKNTGTNGSALSIRTHGASYSETLLGVSMSGTTALVAAPGDLVVGTVDAKFVAFSTNNAERMRITSGGDVGIGTTSTTLSGSPHRLVVQRSGFEQIGLNNGNNTNQSWQFGINDSGLGSAGRFNICQIVNGSTGGIGGGPSVPIISCEVPSAATATPRFLINNVGHMFNTAAASSSAALNLRSNGQTSGEFTIGQGTFSFNDNIAFLWNRSNAALVLGTNNTERMRIDSNGNVGIGTAPSTKFHVLGGRSTFNAGNENYAVYVTYATGYSGMYLGADSSGDFVLSSAGGAGMMRATSRTAGSAGGTTGNAVGFNHAGVFIDRGWGDYPGISVCNANATDNTNQSQFRFHGTNCSYNSYPGTSGSDFSVNVWADGGFTNASDRRFKTNITTIPNALNKVMSIIGRRFQTITSTGKIEQQHTQNGFRFGFIGQELQEAGIDEVYKHHPEDDDGTEGYNKAYGVDYGSVTALLVEAIKELKAELDAAKNRITELENK